MNAPTGTLCLGIDVAWWGGTHSLRASRIETIVAALVDDAASLHFEAVDLSSVPNPAATEYFEANYDADGKLLASGIARVLERYAGRCRRTVVALGAPLLARRRPGQLPRFKATFPGQRSGHVPRDPERELQAARKRVGQAGRLWNRDLKILAGSPPPPRALSIVEELREMGFVLFQGGDATADRQLIETFPSEAIWSLGVAGYYGDATSREIRRYKNKAWRTLPPDEAMAFARRPLLGFSALFRDQMIAGADETMPSWLEGLVAHAAFCALDPRKQAVKHNRLFDGVIESGISFATAVAFTQGCFHQWGGGDDGTVVGPGTLSE